jgi:1,4-alpha-glucan branching enzyme
MICYRFSILQMQRRVPIGAELQKLGGVHFRVWATTSSTVAVCIDQNPEITENAIEAKLEPEGNGYFSGYVADAQAGQFYRLKLGSNLLPDPAARAQYRVPTVHPLLQIRTATSGATKVGAGFRKALT